MNEPTPPRGCMPKVQRHKDANFHFYTKCFGLVPFMEYCSNTHK